MATMEKIKYQAFLHLEKQMINVVEINLFDKFIRYYDLSHCKDGAEAFEFVRENPPNADCPFEYCNLRVFTGLKDMNSNEIYQGDIVSEKWDNPLSNQKEDDRYIVEYDNGQYRMIDINKRPGRDRFLFMQYKRIEVVGNIYENTDFLIA